MTSMRAFAAFTVGAFIVLSGCSGSSSSQPLPISVLRSERANMPRLGSHGAFGADGKGWGTAQPSEIFNGGDPSGLVTDIDWMKWGSPSALGTGRTHTYKPHGGYFATPVKALLRASDLGECDGLPAYRRLDVRVQTKPGGRLQPRWHPWAGNGRTCEG
jgi:hypothetical protein